jgi:hypothetical protein
MVEPIHRSVHQTLINALTILAQQGDEKASEALKDVWATDFEILDGETDEHVEMILEYSDGTYLVTEQGASFCPVQPPD